MLFEGQAPANGRNNPYGTWEPVTPSYFDTLRIPLVHGRLFTDADDAKAAPVAIVSESVAARYWPGQPALGKRLQFTPQSPWATVVGVVADTRYRGRRTADDRRAGVRRTCAARRARRAHPPAWLGIVTQSDLALAAARDLQRPRQGCIQRSDGGSYE
jgi:hypothetical protein